MKKLLLTLSIAALSASAASAVTLAPGTMETRLAGQIDGTSLNGTEIDLNVSWGYFLQDNWQAGGRVSFYDNDNATLYAAAAFTEYNFEIGSEEWLPFVEASLGAAFGDGEGGENSQALTLQVQGGMKYFLAPNVALSAALVLDTATDEIFPDDNKYEKNDARLQLAIRYYY